MKNYEYWRCTHKSKSHKSNQKSIREEKLEEQLNSFLDSIELEERFIRRGLSYIEEYANAELQDRSHIEQAQKEKLTDVQTQLDNLVKLYISPKNSTGALLSEEDYIRQKKELQDNKVATINMLGKLSTRQDEAIEIMEKDINICKEIYKEFNSGDREKKREILSDLARTIVLHDGTAYIQAGLNFMQFKKIKKMVTANPEWLELNPSSRNKDLQLYNKIYAIWSHPLESNQ